MYAIRHLIIRIIFKRMTVENFNLFNFFSPTLVLCQFSQQSSSHQLSQKTISNGVKISHRPIHAIQVGPPLWCNVFNQWTFISNSQNCVFYSKYTILEKISNGSTCLLFSIWCNLQFALKLCTILYLHQILVTIGRKYLWKAGFKFDWIGFTRSTTYKYKKRIFHFWQNAIQSNWRPAVQWCFRHLVRDLWVHIRVMEVLYYYSFTKFSWSLGGRGFRLPSCDPMFESQAHHLSFFQFGLLKLYWENNENKQKEAGIGPFLKNSWSSYLSDCFVWSFKFKVFFSFFKIAKKKRFQIWNFYSDLRLFWPTTRVNVIKLFWRKSRFPEKLRTWIKFVLMTEPTQKC